MGFGAAWPVSIQVCLLPVANGWATGESLESGIPVHTPKLWEIPVLSSFSAGVYHVYGLFSNLPRLLLAQPT